MKKAMFAGIVMLTAITVFAQGPQKPPPPDERWKHDSKMITEKASIDAASVEKMKPSFMAFYKNLDAMMETHKGERPKKEEVEPLIKKRNDAIKKILKDVQFQSFVKMERELGPRPPGGKNMPPPKN
jgi:hypothetical protein